MATPAEKLAQSLEVLQGLQKRNVIAIRSGDLPRVHRERLLANGFLHEVMKGWYIPSRPDEVAGDSTAWYASYWGFCAAYLNERFGKGWCLSPERSLSLHAGNWTVPGQLLVRTPKGGNKITGLPHNTSLLDVRYAMPEAKNIEEKDGLRLYSPPSALVGCTPGYFTQNPIDVRAVLSMVRDSSDILAQLLEGGHTTIAGRLAGAFRNIGRDRIADETVKTMQAAGYDVRELDPFEAKPPALFASREISPYVNRIRLMWADMRETVIGRFPKSPGLPKNIEAYMARVDEVFVTDAYHSLSIEGYRVSPELIEQVRSGEWNPDNKEADKAHHDALAARGYYQAFQTVKASVERVLGGKNSGTVTDEDHGDWYREMFAPSAVAGVVKAVDLAGYRGGPVFIRKSRHVPPSRDAVRDLMPAFFELLREETDATVRVVLGHFVFVYIHPYVDGNGRMGRFLMNVMLAAGGYPWTVIPLQERDAYMAALEEASVQQNIVPFAEFLAHLVDANLKGTSAPKVPGQE